MRNLLVLIPPLYMENTAVRLKVEQNQLVRISD